MPVIELSTSDLRDLSNWRTSGNGNFVCDFRELKLTIFSRDGKWKFCIRFEDGPLWSKPFFSQEDATEALIEELDLHYLECERDARREQRRSEQEDRERKRTMLILYDLAKLWEIEAYANEQYEQTGDEEFREVAERCRETINRVCAAQEGEL